MDMRNADKSCCCCFAGRTFSTLTTALCVQLEELNITGEQSNDNWHVGLDCIPDEWAGMTRLTKLELRGHSLLNVSQIHEKKYDKRKDCAFGTRLMRSQVSYRAAQGRETPSNFNTTLLCHIICPCTMC